MILFCTHPFPSQEGNKKFSAKRNSPFLLGGREKNPLLGGGGVGTKFKL